MASQGLQLHLVFCGWYYPCTADDRAVYSRVVCSLWFKQEESTSGNTHQVGSCQL